MHYRKLGQTGISISEVGLGCNRIGDKNQPDEHWVRLVQRAVDLGVTIFDTSEQYAGKRSELMLGRALGNRDDVYIATKMSRHGETKEPDFSAARMIKTVEESLKRLQRDYIDIYQLHSPNRADMEQFDWAEGMAKLKAQGKIRFCAVAVRSSADAIWLIEQGFVEVLQITYNLFERQAADTLFDIAAKHGVGLLGRMPLARGVLTGKFQPGQAVPEGHRALLDGKRMRINIEKAADLHPLSESYLGGMTRLAHHFSLTPTAMSAIIPGARTLSQLEENVAASNGAGLPPTVREKVKQVYTGWATQEKNA